MKFTNGAINVSRGKLFSQLLGERQTKMIRGNATELTEIIVHHNSGNLREDTNWEGKRKQFHYFC